MYYIYVLKSKTKKFRYVGMTSDIVRRIKEHNNGKSKSTKGFLPFVLILTEKFKTRKEARVREKYLKSGIGREFLDTL